MSDTNRNEVIHRQVDIFRSLGCKRILIKHLSENDNSKNQVYFGPNFEILNLFPNLDIFTDSSSKGTTFKAIFDFSWVSQDGKVSPAPHSKLILYPQYPEVRFSGFLKGSRYAPSSLMAGRIKDRILVLGIKETGQIFGNVFLKTDSINNELITYSNIEQQGVFEEIPVDENQKTISTRSILIEKLVEIYNKGWIHSRRLMPDGSFVSCNATNCGGYTLEAELGITPNGISEPDYLGWEIKQHAVRNFETNKGGPITLMTPEPTGGYYVEKGVPDFIRKYGYADLCGRPDRLNFGGVYKANKRYERTKLTLVLHGFNTETMKITDASGVLALITDNDEIAASWGFAELMRHWNRKHAKAAYIPSMNRKAPSLQYRFGNIVRLCTGTDFLTLLKAFAIGDVYYDPGIKLENVSTPIKEEVNLE